MIPQGESALICEVGEAVYGVPASMQAFDCPDCNALNHSLFCVLASLLSKTYFDSAIEMIDKWERNYPHVNAPFAQELHTREKSIRVFEPLQIQPLS